MSSSDLMFLNKAGVEIGDYYYLYINGEQVTYGGRNKVCISISSDFTYEFFVFKAVEGGSPVRERSEGLSAEIIKMMDDQVFLGVDFTGWFLPSNNEMTRPLRIKTKPALKIMFYETMPYFILKRRFTDPSHRSTSIVGEGGKTLDTVQLNAMRNEFRARGFLAYLRMTDSKSLRRVVDYRGLSLVPRMFTCVFAQIEDLYHPLMDDPEIRSDFFNSEFGAAVQAKMVATNRGTSYAFLSHYEISNLIKVGGVNDPRLLHFKFSHILTMLAAKYVVGLDPTRFPYKGPRVYLRQMDIGNMTARVIDESRYRQLPEEYRNTDYFTSYDSFSFFWLIQRPFLRKFNMRDRDVSDADLIEMTSEIRI